MIKLTLSVGINNWEWPNWHFLLVSITQNDRTLTLCYPFVRAGHIVTATEADLIVPLSWKHHPQWTDLFDLDSVSVAMEMQQTRSVLFWFHGAEAAVCSPFQYPATPKTTTKCFRLYSPSARFETCSHDANKQPTILTNTPPSTKTWHNYNVLCLSAKHVV